MVKTPCSNAGGMGSIPGWGTKIPYAAPYGKKKQQKKGLIFIRWNKVRNWSDQRGSLSTLFFNSKGQVSLSLDVNYFRF